MSELMEICEHLLYDMHPEATLFRRERILKWGKLYIQFKDDEVWLGWRGDSFTCYKLPKEDRMEFLSPLRSLFLPDFRDYTLDDWYAFLKENGKPSYDVFSDTVTLMECLLLGRKVLPYLRSGHSLSVYDRFGDSSNPPLLYTIRAILDLNTKSRQRWLIDYPNGQFVSLETLKDVTEHLGIA